MDFYGQRLSFTQMQVIFAEYNKMFERVAFKFSALGKIYMWLAQSNSDKHIIVLNIQIIV